jgi:adenylate kinase
MMRFCTIPGGNGVNIILIGAQGSGKGTQAERLAQSLHIRHVASGDLFRKEMGEGTELGRKAKKYIDRGELVPDDLTVAMILGRINAPDCASGVVLDGFPRTVAQAHALDEGLKTSHKAIDAAVYLEVPREELVERLSGRYICRAHQHVYNIHTNPPKVPGVCDIDGSELYQRSDDRGEAVQKRLDIFFHETIRLLDHYQEQGKLLRVNGKQSIEQVTQSILATLRDFHAGDE